MQPGEAHALFLTAIGGDPKSFNLSDLAARSGLNVSRLWSWANGKSRWPADSWLTVMRVLGAATSLPDGSLQIQAPSMMPPAGELA